MLRKSAMYNLKVSTAFAPGGGGGGGGGGPPGSGLLSVDPQGVTPRTPEILNSLMAMSHPLDPFANSSTPNASAAVPELGSPNGVSGSSLVGSPGRSPPSLQHTRSQLIKEGLKLTLQTKRRHTSATSCASVSGASGDEDDDSVTSGKRLTPEDEERRRRRRERNKVAATKCRIKKRERTVNLVQESEILESQNYELKSQIQELETQRRRLVDMLSSHSPSCTRPGHVHQPAGAPPPPPHYDLYSPTYSPAAPSGAAPAHHTPSAYADVLMTQYCHGQEAGAADEEALTPYFPGVTKHEIVDDPLLAGLDDPLDVYGAYQHPGLEHGVDHPYGRPNTLHLDTPASTPGSSAPSPAQHGMAVGAPLPGPGCPPCPPCPTGILHQSPTHLYQHQQHMLNSPLTPMSSDGVSIFGMDSGCMA
ncbi:activating transcription factor 3 isoform X2 [Frankliniella occidentalis]|uniref:Activating transcription factor 3 isoform X2 n=1 Tax=Frankliniella occidentalis TaxID=133901 RepID=A0A6J1T8E1_FRAOC|nr:activating transcription factor 3 isoform X2 [Frankliniella occidentalis]